MAIVFQFPAPAGLPHQALNKKTPGGIQKRKRGTQAQDTRKFMLAKIHIAKNQTGTSEAEYRAALEGRYGVASAGDLNLKQMHDFLLFFSKGIINVLITSPESVLYIISKSKSLKLILSILYYKSSVIIKFH